eukprot:gene9320-16451_t
MDKILNASYGMGDQREANRRPSDREAAAKIERERRQRMGGKENEQGQAYGGHATPNRMAKVEIRPGVFHHVPEYQGAKGGPGQGRGRPSSAPVHRRPGEAMNPKPYQVDTLALAPVLAKVEEQMREQLKKRSELHMPEKVLLLRAFGKALGKIHVDIGVTDKLMLENDTVQKGAFKAGERASHMGKIQ